MRKFLSELGSQKGAPGGGAAAALTGAAGVALVEMVARLNDKRHGGSLGTAKKAEAARKKFERLISEDAKAFAGIQRVYRTRKQNPALWQKALKSGAACPLEICTLCASSASLAGAEKKRTSSWLESDRKEALILLEAAFRAAVLNVEVNLKEIADRPYRDRLRKKVAQCRQTLKKY